VEAALVGQTAGPEAFSAAADALLKDAQPLQHNAFKITLAHRAIVRALGQAALQGVRP
jgi:xanthine dehydrogenase YagS FAD-binding subunit